MDPLYWVAARVMFFHKMPALLPLDSNETSPGSKTAVWNSVSLAFSFPGSKYSLWLKRS